MSKKSDSPLSPGMRESVHLLPNNFRHHPNNGIVNFHYVPEKSEHHPEKEIVQIRRWCIGVSKSKIIIFLNKSNHVKGILIWELFPNVCHRIFNSPLDIETSKSQKRFSYFSY